MDKPWTAPGLSSDKRLLALLPRTGYIISPHMVREALDAHARDAKPQWTKVDDGLPLNSDAVLCRDANGTKCMASYYKQWYPTLRDFVPVEWFDTTLIAEPPREDTP